MGCFLPCPAAGTAPRCLRSPASRSRTRCWCPTPRCRRLWRRWQSWCRSCSACDEGPPVCWLLLERVVMMKNKGLPWRPLQAAACCQQAERSLRITIDWVALGILGSLDPHPLSAHPCSTTPFTLHVHSKPSPSPSLSAHHAKPQPSLCIPSPQYSLHTSHPPQALSTPLHPCPRLPKAP